MHELAAERLERFAGLGPEQLARLRRCRVAVIGLGALGGPFINHLAMLGVALDLVDHDVVSLENLANQAFAYGDVGRPKAEARAEVLRALNPDCQVRAWPCRLEDIGLATFADVDLIVTALDSISARALACEIAASVGVPMLDAAVDGSGELLQGNVTAFAPAVVADTACFLCQYDAASLANATGGEKPQHCPRWRDTPTAITPPTLQASAFGALIASMQAMWAVRLLVGDAGELIGNRLYVAMRGPVPVTRIAAVARRDPCLVDHAPLAPVVERGDETIGDSVAAVEARAGAVVERARFHHRTIARGLFCTECGAADIDFVHVAATATEDQATCERCDHALTAARLTDALDRADLDRFASTRWSALGLPARDVVSLSWGGDAGRALHIVPAALGTAADTAERRS